MNDQSKNLYGVIYENNPDPEDLGYQTCEAHRVSNACCDTSTWSTTQGCTNIPTNWPDRSYQGTCTGDVLGLFAYQNVFRSEDPSPRSHETTGGFIHQSAWQVNIEALIIAANNAWHTEHALPNYPEMGEIYLSEPSIDIDDRDDYMRINRAQAYDNGPMGTSRLLGGVIQQLRGISRSGSSGYYRDERYDYCFQYTGPPPFTPLFTP